MSQKNINANKDRMYVLDSLPVNKAIWTLAIPTMMAMLVQVVYNMTDTFFIGQLNNPNMVAAISIAMPIFMIIQAFGNVFAVGGASIISRLLGKGEKEDASKTGAIAFWSSLTACTIASIIGFIFMDDILILTGASANTIEFARSYLVIIIVGGPFMGMKMSLSGLLRSEGATKESMVGLMLGSILNIVLDPIFIFGLNMGVAGAALATTVGNMVGFIYFLSFYIRKQGLVSISPKHFSFDKTIYKGIFKIGIPASLGMVLMSLGFAVANIFASNFGDDVVAANGVVMRVSSIGFMMTIGLAQGCQPLMGYCYGAKKYERLIETIKRAAIMRTIMCIIFSSIFMIFSETLIKVFINDENVMSLGAQILRRNALALPFLGIQMVLMTMFQSLGKTVESLIVSLGRQGIFFVPSLIIFSTLWGYNGFILAQPFADIATTTLSVTLFFLMKKSLTADIDVPIKNQSFSNNISLEGNRVGGR